MKIHVLQVGISLMTGSILIIFAAFLLLKNFQSLTLPSSASPSSKKTSQTAISKAPETSPSKPAMTSAQVPTIDIEQWKTYTSKTYGFSIRYPQTVPLYKGQWEYREFPLEDNVRWVGFRPNTMNSDYLWSVDVFSNKSVEKLIEEQGAQFYDRKESRKNITVNGTPALLVTVTTNQFPTWISKSVIIEKNGKVYKIGNGAIEIAEFDDFYNSFKILN